MPEQSNNPFNFWQELKRRKVFRVIVMYAGAAYIIIELVNNIAEPLLLPDWTATLVILLLIIGFPIVAILSWIFDMTPEGLKKTEPAIVIEQSTVKTKKRRLKISDVVIAILIVAVVILAYPRIFKRDRLQYLQSKGEISVAVMPFKNMTGDDSLNFWQEMVQDNLITSLSNAEPLQVRQSESITTLLDNANITNFASVTPSIAGNISQKLNASVFVCGSVNQVGETIRLNAKLVDSETEEIFKSFQVDGTAERILYLADTLSLHVRNFLVVNILKKELTPDFMSFIGNTKSPEAIKYILEGNEEFLARKYPAATELIHKAIECDSNFIMAYVHLAYAYGNQGLYDDAKKWTRMAYDRRDNLSRMERIFTDMTYATYFGTPHDEIKYLKKSLDLDDQQPMIYYNLGLSYMQIRQYDKAIPEYEKAIEIFNNWDIQPSWIYNYTGLGIAYHNLGLYRKEKKLYRKAEKDFPDDRVLISKQAILALSQGEEEAANRYIEKYVTLRKENSFSERSTLDNLGNIYSVAKRYDKAEEYYRQALSLAPDNPVTLNNLAFFLIDNDRNIDEGLELVSRALEIKPDDYNYLDTKGWGLYKQGKYNEALEILEKSWDLKPVYRHGIYQHLEEARKAAARLDGES